MIEQLSDLPDVVSKSLTDFVNAAKVACESNLESVVLFGSVAEERLRPSSDVNLILLLKEFEVSQVDQSRLVLITRVLNEVSAEVWSEHLAFVRAGKIEIGYLAAPPRSNATIEGASEILEFI